MSNYYVAFDPGKDTGVAAYNEKGVLQETNIIRGMLDLDNYLDKIEEAKETRVIIYEKYRAGYSAQNLTTKKYATIHGGKPLITEQVIGMILRTARKIGAEIVGQEPSILNVAQLWTGYKIPKNHDQSHHISAMCHGMYYLIDNKIVKPRVLENYEKGE